jgi:hypothetical protein
MAGEPRWGLCVALFAVEDNAARAAGRGFEFCVARDRIVKLKRELSLGGRFPGLSAPVLN